MPDSVPAWLVILAMAAVTYGLRAGGYLVMGRVTLTPPVRRALEALPGAILIATVAPVALRGGGVALAALAVTAAVMALSRKDTLAVAAAVGVAALARSFGL
ncbi:AzlD family protein [Prosthecomicrobium sp. N25]|uniref:AzlD family protein n=1 Tax=Prosthecomicrobium sp. N25 TaxID=3129254 RepID=UPI0030772AAE